MAKIHQRERPSITTQASIATLGLSARARHTRRTIALAAAGMSLLMVGACATPPPATEAPAPEQTEPQQQVFSSNYITIHAPTSGGWALIEESNSGILFAKGDQTANDRFVAKVTLFGLQPTETDEAFQILIESMAAKDLDLTRFEVQSENFRYTQERPYPCVRYQSVANDKATRAWAEPLILELDALYCRHPVQEETGFSVIFSHLGYTAHPQLRMESEAFIQGVQTPGV
jgi:hypothetical protein